MDSWREQIGRGLSEFLQSVGINPIYLAAAVFLFFLFRDYKKIKRWKELPRKEKTNIILVILGAIVAVTISVLMAFE